jgi:hypothetical protein
MGRFLTRRQELKTVTWNYPKIGMGYIRLRKGGNSTFLAGSAAYRSLFW